MSWLNIVCVQGALSASLQTTMCITLTCRCKQGCITTLQKEYSSRLCIMCLAAFDDIAQVVAIYKSSSPERWNALTRDNLQRRKSKPQNSPALVLIWYDTYVLLSMFGADWERGLDFVGDPGWVVVVTTLLTLIVSGRFLLGARYITNFVSLYRRPWFTSLSGAGLPSGSGKANAVRDCGYTLFRFWNSQSI